MDPMKSSGKIDPRWAWHFATLQTLREQLIRVRDEHRSDTSGSVERGGVDPADRATDEVGREVVMAELNAEEAELTAIDAALQRINDGTYGICLQTEKPISADRLRAVPWTPYSREAAARLEQAGGNAAAAARK